MRLTCITLNLQILLDNCQLLKLSDFTLAQSMEDSDRQVQYDYRRAAQMAFGELQRGGSETLAAHSVDAVPSPFYAAPELFEGGRFDVASDLWSLGVLTYELCTGEQKIERKVIKKIDSDGKICQVYPRLAHNMAG